MKRMIALLAIVPLLLVSVALAQGEPLMRGVAWGATLEEVLAAEGNPRAERDREAGFEVLEIDDTSALGAAADLEYFFLNDALVAARYEFADRDPNAEAELLASALRKVYGEPAYESYGRPDEANAERLKALEDILDGENERRAYDTLVTWELADGTYIALSVEQDDDAEEPEILICDEAALLGK